MAGARKEVVCIVITSVWETGGCRGSVGNDGGILCCS